MFIDHIIYKFAGSTLDIDLPFTLFQYSFSSGLGRSSRTLEDEQEGLYQWAEGLLKRQVYED